MARSSILIVDDMPGVAESAEGMLEAVRINHVPDAQFDYLQAPNADSGLEIIRKDIVGAISLVLVDREMPPGMSGSDMLRLLSQIDPHWNQKLKVMVTGELSERSEIFDLLKTGKVNAVFRKDGFLPKVVAPILKAAHALKDPDVRKLPKSPVQIPLVKGDKNEEKRILSSLNPKIRVNFEEFLAQGRQSLLDKFGVLPNDIRKEIEDDLKKSR